MLSFRAITRQRFQEKARHKIILKKRRTRYVDGSQGSLFYRSLVGSEPAIMGIVRSFLSRQQVAQMIRVENSSYVHAQSHPILLTDMLIIQKNKETKLPRIAQGPLRPTWIDMQDQDMTNLNTLKYMTTLTTLNLSCATGPWIRDVGAYACLPISVTTLILPRMSEGPFGQFPPSLTSLTMGQCCRVALTPGMLPETLLHLQMSFQYLNRTLVKGSLPESLTSLHLPHYSSQSLVTGPGILPESLTSIQLHINGINLVVLQPDVFPSRLTKMEIISQCCHSQDTHMRLILPTIPITVTHLIVSNLTTTICLPPFLEHLQYKYSFIPKEHVYYYPPTLKNLQIGFLYKNKYVPEGIEKVNNTCDEIWFPILGNVYPVSLTELTIDSHNVLTQPIMVVDVLEDAEKLVNLRSIIMKKTPSLCFRVPSSITSIETDRLPMYLEKVADGGGSIVHHCFREVTFTITISDSSIDIQKLHNALFPLDIVTCRMKHVSSTGNHIHIFHLSYPMCWKKSFNDVIIEFLGSCLSLSVASFEHTLVGAYGTTYSVPDRLSVHVDKIF